MAHPPEENQNRHSIHGEILPPEGEDLIRSFGQALSPLVRRFGFEGIEPIGLLIGRLERLDPRAARRLLENGPALIGELGPHGPETIRDLFEWSHAFLPFGAFPPVHFLEASPHLLKVADPLLLKEIVFLLADKGRECPSLVSPFLEGSGRLLGSGGFSLLKEGVECCFALARISPTYAHRTLSHLPDLLAPLIVSSGLEMALNFLRVATRMAETDWHCALDWLHQGPLLFRNYGERKRLNLLADLFREEALSRNFHPRLFFTLVEKTPEMADLLGEEGQHRTLDLVKTMAFKDPEKALSLMQGLPEILQSLKAKYDAFMIHEILHRGKVLQGLAADLVFPFFKAIHQSERPWKTEEIAVLLTYVKEVAESSLHLAEAFLTTLPSWGREIPLPDIYSKVSDLRPLARTSWETAVKILRHLPSMLPRLPGEGWQEFLQFISTLTVGSGSSVHTLIERSPALLASWWDLGGAEGIQQICRIGRQWARENPRIALSLVLYSPDWIRTAGWEGWERIGVLALALGRTNWAAAVALVETGPRLWSCLTFEELERFFALVETLSRKNAYAAQSLVVKGPDLLDRLQESGAGAETKRIFFAMVETSLTGPRWVSGLLEKGPFLFSLIGPEDFPGWLDLLGALSLKNEQWGGQFLEATPRLHPKLGAPGWEKVASLFLTLADTEQTDSPSALEKTANRVLHLGQQHGRQTAQRVLDMAVQIAESQAALALKILEKSPEFLEGVGLEGLGLLAAHLQSLAEKEEEKVLTLLSSDSLSWVDFLENIPKGLDLEAVKPVLSHYLKALLGRRVEIVASKEATGDGMKIFLPRRVREFQDPEDNFLFYKVAATHEEAHLEYGSYEFELDRLDVQPLKEIPSQEGLSDLERFFQTFPEPALARDVFHLLEDRRVEKRLACEYPALGEAIDKMHRHQAAKKGSPAKLTHPKERAVGMVEAFLTTGQVFPEADPAIQTLLQGLKEKIQVLDQPEADVYASARLAWALYGEIAALSEAPYRPTRPLSKPLDQETVTRQMGSFGKTSRRIRDKILGKGGKEEPPSGPRPETESPGLGTLRPTGNRPAHSSVPRRPTGQASLPRTFQGPEGGGEPKGGWDQMDREETSEPDDFLNLAAPERIERLLKTLYREKGITPKEVERRIEGMNLSELFLFLNHAEAAFPRTHELTPETGTYLYPEWGEDIGDYRSRWTRVREQTLPGGSLAFYREVMERYAPLLKKVRREFQTLKPEGLIRRKRQYDGNEIDLEAAVEFWSDRKAGFSPAERLYGQKQRRQRDIAVAFLVDMSRSTRGPTIEREKEALIILSEALEEVGDAFAIYGFSGDNRDNVDFYRIKEFEEPYNQGVKKRISAVSDRFENRDGAAIRHATEKLRRRPERTRLMILLSDGKPVDKEYSGTYAVEDTRMALKEAERLGIKTFCITVDREAPEYLPRMYSHSRWTLLDRLEWLPEKITRLYRRLTA